MDCNAFILCNPNEIAFFSASSTLYHWQYVWKLWLDRQKHTFNLLKTISRKAHHDFFLCITVIVRNAINKIAHEMPQFRCSHCRRRLCFFVNWKLLQIVIVIVVNLLQMHSIVALTAQRLISICILINTWWLLIIYLFISNIQVCLLYANTHTHTYKLQLIFCI